MKINDKRETTKNLVFFEQLDIGEVYEDESGFICIKTNCGEINCIAFVDGNWLAEHEDFSSQVVRVEADLVLRRNR